MRDSGETMRWYDALTVMRAWRGARAVACSTRCPNEDGYDAHGACRVAPPKGEVDAVWECPFFPTAADARDVTVKHCISEHRKTAHVSDRDFWYCWCRWAEGEGKT